ncbi:crcB protein [gamma proteobacterium IMCC1989]|nr:crcB protein [gamma proteobacterium IMCC1989]
MIWLAVALGGALGAISRYGLMQYLMPVEAKQFPWGTLTVNIVGSALIGLCYVLLVEKQWGDIKWVAIEWRPFLMVGFLGAFTTYSTFALESFLLWQEGQTYYAISYAIASLLGCILAVTASIFIATKLFH